MQISSPDQFVGQDIGAYQVERLLGSGRISAVYLAYHTTHNNPVALMTFILPESFSSGAQQRFWDRFQRKASRLTTLQHPHILPVHDYGEYAGYPYLITPYMTNGSLADLLKRKGRLHHTEVLDILQQVVAGLAHAHNNKIIHTALKPSNIVLNDQQEILVAGFGLTQILQMRGIKQDERPYGHLFSVAGTFLTPAEYIAPEIVEGQSADARTDVYSLGVILFELLSGKPPFKGKNPLEVALQHVQQPVPSLHTQCPDIPLALAAVVNQALDRDPTRRFQRIDELAEAFEQVSTAFARKDNRKKAKASSVQNTVEAMPDTESAPGRWQLQPPIVTNKIAAIDLTARTTNDPEQVQSAPPTRSTKPRKPEPLVTAISDLEESPLENIEEDIFDLLAQPLQEPMPLRNTKNPTRWNTSSRNTNAKNANSALSSAKENLRSLLFEDSKNSKPGSKTRGNTRLSRRKVVALLATGGAVAAGAAFAINLTGGNTTNQQAQTNAANLAKNAALNFTNPANGKASVLVHLSDGNFVAYERACTHVGVYVNYDPAQKLLVCPAHGATFDPAQNAAVKQGPATKPLPKVTVHINSDGSIT
jgi:serine/threonine protein kinase/nitrite reductase/ring-hydroxylating ferredoxin subunit